VQAPEYNLPRFMQRLQSRIARKLNKLYERKGKFFEGRYKKADLLDEDAALERFDYVTNLPISAGLVDRIEDWPGLSAWEYIKDGVCMEGRWVDRAEWRRLHRKTFNKYKKYNMPEDAGEKTHSFQITH